MTYEEREPTAEIDWQAPLAANPEMRTQAVRIYEKAQVEGRGRAVSEVQAVLREESVAAGIDPSHEWVDLAALALHRGQMILPVDASED